MRHTFLIWPVIVLLAIGLSCGKSHSSSTPPGATVYVAGAEQLGSNAVYTAYYWTNSTPTPLTNDNLFSEATGIVASADSGLYICGDGMETGKAHNVARYWHNGVNHDLTDGAQDAFAKGIALLGSDVYVCGMEVSPNLTYPVYIVRYWKNGQMVTLSDSSYMAYCFGMTISGSDVYVVGAESNGPHLVAKYWKNGVSYDLSDGANDEYATSIAVVGNDVYAAGYEYSNNFLIAKYWHNGVEDSLSKVPDQAMANGIAVSGANVYVAGFESNGPETNSELNYVAKYWQNGTSMPLTADYPHHAMAQGITFVNGALYVVGYDYDSTTNQQSAKLWTNGNATVLSPSDIQTAEALAVFVRP